MTLQEVLTNIEETIKRSLQQLGYFDASIDIALEVPKDKSNGDYSANVAMKYAKIARKNPMVIAEEIISNIDKETLFINEITLARPGFINFILDKSFLLETINTINALESLYGSVEQQDNERYNIEFVSVNPTGAIHIGHARGAAAGDSLCRIMKKAGYNVTKEYYVNDAGNQIHNLALSIEARYKQQFGVTIDMPEDGYYGPEIIDTAQTIIADVGDQFLHEDGYAYFRKFGVDSLLEGLKHDLEQYRVHFDIWFSEGSLYDNNLVDTTVQQLIEGGFTYEKDGATWLKTSEYGDEKDRVIIKSDGTYTYLTPDIAYHKNKMDRGFTKLIDILGGDHHGYINRLKAAIEMITGEANILEVELLQMVKVIQNGEEVKMSKRSGKAITLGDLMEEVGPDPIRYFFAARSLNTQMDLDLDLAIRQTNENPVYYVQYAHARIASIFETAKERGITYVNQPFSFSSLDGEKTYDLITQLANYPSTIEAVAQTRAPHRLVHYIYQVASAFHSFYNQEQVIQADHVRTQERLALLHATKIVLQDALSLIGVSAPEKM